MTCTELLNVWRARDNLYSRRKAPLSDAELEAATTWRRREADDLDPRDRTVALVALAHWVPRTSGR